MLPLPGGATAGSLADALAGESALLEKHLGRHAQVRGNPFAALNQAFFLDGAFIHVPAGIELPEPIQLVFISSARKPGATIQPRNLIIAEANSKLTVIESYIAPGSSVYFTNAVTELIAGDNATVEHLKFQDESTHAFHIATIQGHFGRASRVNVHSFALGAKLSRNNIRAELAGEGLECILNGLYLTRDEFWKATWLRDPDIWLRARETGRARMHEYQRTVAHYRSESVGIGLEVDADGAGRLMVADEDLEGLDVLVGAVHFVPEGASANPSAGRVFRLHPPDFHSP